MKKLITFVAILSVCLSIFALPTDAEIKDMANKLNVDYSDLKSYVISHQKVEEIDKVEEEPAETAGLLFEVEEGEAVCVGSGDEEIKNLVIPEKYEGYPVVGVAEYAFEFRDDIETLILPKSIKWMGESAFEGCSNLKRVEIHSTKLDIYNGIFHQIPDLDIYWYGLNALGNKDYLSYLCEKSARLHVITTADEIVDSAFYNIDQLVSIEFSENLKKINRKAFYNCTSLESILLPEGVTYIGTSAFESCSALKSVYIPDSVTELGKNAFCAAYSLETVNLPSGLTTIRHGLFSLCTALKSITIPSTVTEIEQYAFSSCESLENITLPSGLTTIGENAFGNCTSMKSFELPINCSNIENSIFSGSGIESFTCPSPMKQIPSSFFKDCENLKTVKFNRRISSIGASAFSGCKSLETVELPSSVKSIDYKVFEGCTALTEIFIPNSVTYMGDNCFYDCNDNLTVYLEEGINTSSWKNNWDVVHKRRDWYYGPTTYSYVNVEENATR